MIFQSLKIYFHPLPDQGDQIEWKSTIWAIFEGACSHLQLRKIAPFFLFLISNFGHFLGNLGIFLGFGFIFGIFKHSDIFKRFLK